MIFGDLVSTMFVLLFGLAHRLFCKFGLAHHVVNNFQFFTVLYFMLHSVTKSLVIDVRNMASLIIDFLSLL